MLRIAEAHMTHFGNIQRNIPVGNVLCYINTPIAMTKAVDDFYNYTHSLRVSCILLNLVCAGCGQGSLTQQTVTFKASLSSAIITNQIQM